MKKDIASETVANSIIAIISRNGFEADELSIAVPPEFYSATDAGVDGKEILIHATVSAKDKSKGYRFVKVLLAKEATASNSSMIVATAATARDMLNIIIARIQPKRLQIATL